MTALHRRHTKVRLRGTGSAVRTSQRGPACKPGQIRCPVCRKPVTPLENEALRFHRDLFGHPCYNRKAEL